MKLNIPGITFKSFVFTSWPHSFVCGFLVLCFSMVWRAQLAQRGRAAGMPSTDIPKLDTAKAIAGPVMNHPVPKQVLGAQAVFSTVVWEAGLISPETTRIEKDAIVAKLAVEIISGKAPAKVLTPKQLNPETVNLHRRGLVAQSLGKIQGDAIYSPTSIIQGADIHNLTFSEFFNGFLGVCELIGINKEVLAISLHPENFNFPGGCATTSGSLRDLDPPLEISLPVQNQVLEDYAFNYIKNFLSGLAGSKGFLSFNDGVTLNWESNNLMPLEAGLPIVRQSPPSAFASLQEDPSDPYAALANSQIKEFNASIKDVRKPKTATNSSTPTPNQGRRTRRAPSAKPKGKS